MVGHIDHRLHVGVVDDLDVAARVDDLRRADADLLDRAAETVDHDDVADVEDLFKDDVKSGDDVGDQRLRAETDDQAEDPDTGEDRRGIKSRGLQNEEEQNDHRRVFDQAAEDLDDRLPAVKQAGELHEREPDDETHAEQEDRVTDDADRDIELPGFAEDVETAPEGAHGIEHLVTEDHENGVDDQDQIRDALQDQIRRHLDLEIELARLLFVLHFSNSLP